MIRAHLCQHGRQPSICAVCVPILEAELANKKRREQEDEDRRRRQADDDSAATTSMLLTIAAISVFD